MLLQKGSQCLVSHRFLCIHPPAIILEHIWQLNVACLAIVNYICRFQALVLSWGRVDNIRFFCFVKNLIFSDKLTLISKGRLIISIVNTYDLDFLLFDCIILFVIDLIFLRNLISVTFLSLWEPLSKESLYKDDAVSQWHLFDYFSSRLRSWAIRRKYALALGCSSQILTFLMRFESGGACRSECRLVLDAKSGLGCLVFQIKLMVVVMRLDLYGVRLVKLAEASLCLSHGLLLTQSVSDIIDRVRVRNIGSWCDCHLCNRSRYVWALSWNDNLMDSIRVGRHSWL